MEKIQLVRGSAVEDLAEDEYFAAMKTVSEMRDAKKLHTELQQMSPEDAEKARSSGRAHGDPFFVVNE